MATNIRNIVARFSVLSNQASASQILSGRAAYNYAGTKINGTHTCSTVWYSTTLKTANNTPVSTTLSISDPTNYIAYHVVTSNAGSSQMYDNTLAYIRLGSRRIWIYVYEDGFVREQAMSDSNFSIVGNTLTIRGRNQYYYAFPPNVTVKIYYSA